MKLTVIFATKQIGLETTDATWPVRRFHTINDDTFWNSFDQDISAIQYHTGYPQYCEMEMKTHSGKNNVKLTNQDEAFLQQFVDKFNQREADYQQLVTAINTWNNDVIEGEKPAEKVVRLGPRPSTY
jgi:hypothetical protein